MHAYAYENPGRNVLWNLLNKYTQVSTNTILNLKEMYIKIDDVEAFSASINFIK